MTMAVPCGLRPGYNAVGGQVLVIFSVKNDPCYHMANYGAKSELLDRHSCHIHACV